MSSDLSDKIRTHADGLESTKDKMPDPELKTQIEGAVKTARDVAKSLDEGDESAAVAKEFVASPYYPWA